MNTPEFHRYPLLPPHIAEARAIVLTEQETFFLGKDGFYVKRRSVAREIPYNVHLEARR